MFVAMPGVWREPVWDRLKVALAFVRLDDYECTITEFHALKMGHPDNPVFMG